MEELEMGFQLMQSYVTYWNVQMREKPLNF